MGLMKMPVMYNGENCFLYMDDGEEEHPVTTAGWLPEDLKPPQAEINKLVKDIQAGHAAMQAAAAPVHCSSHYTSYRAEIKKLVKDIQAGYAAVQAAADARLKVDPICNCGDPMFLPHRTTCPVVCCESTSR